MRKVILFANSSWYFYNFKKNLISELKKSGYEVLLISPEDRYSKKLTEEGYTWKPIFMNRLSLNPFSQAILIWNLAKIYKIENPIITHHFTIKSVILGSLAAIVARVPHFVNSVAGLGYTFTSSQIKARLLRLVLKPLLRAILFYDKSVSIFQNNSDVSRITDKNISSDLNYRLIKGSGIDTRVYGELRDNRLCNQKIRVVMACRLIWDKGIAEYFEAAKILHQRKIDVEFILAGSPDPGNPRSVRKTQLDELNYDNFVHILGHVDNISELLCTADIFALPSSYGEGVPKSLLEAGAAGLALVTTDIPGCIEVIKHEETGLLIPLNDPIALADAIERLIKNPALRDKLGQNAKNKILNEFDEQVITAQTIDIYNKLYF